MTHATISVISFGGGFNLPLWAAQACGYFERHGVTMELHFTADSRQVFRGLADGTYHVALTALDNIVAHQERQTAAVSEGAPDFFAFMGSDEGFLSLVSAPDIRSFADLAGRALSVDDPSNGFSMVLREMLAMNGLAPDDVEWQSAGATDRRYAALVAGQHAATMLRTPFDLLALQAGCHRLGKVRELIGPYMGIVGAARRAWAASNGEALVGFVRAYRDAVGWLHAPANREAAETLLRAGVPSMSAELGRLSCDALLNPEDGFYGDVRLDPKGVEAVLRLRSRYADTPRPLNDASRYVDLQYWSAA
ncbi:ABC transporter substrate-binding protein [Variovorax sp. Sphag1AA]|uniref:ABC transporter substrate-binding protein n=1 Tax=Variovorax sp. Sphag1AA TaxID=2587027 RepID=UPI0016142233|nr:ABC transporter substrate-binding protein [Variovorax sp. Sphag1AA]MBB3181628.1 ABC-type nitrate/sulfonate/bicarbonate transport system substrate-binding protein [Variovorax sp. Sphag1AA]